MLAEQIAKPKLIERKNDLETAAKRKNFFSSSINYDESKKYFFVVLWEKKLLVETKKYVFCDFMRITLLTLVKPIVIFLVNLWEKETVN